MAPIIARMAVIRRKHGELADQLWISEARANEWLDLIQRDIGCNDQRQPVYVAIIHDLKEFFLGPGSGRLRAEVIQHQQRRSADLLEALLEGDIRGIERETQQVE